MELEPLTVLKRAQEHASDGTEQGLADPLILARHSTNGRTTPSTSSGWVTTLRLACFSTVAIAALLLLWQLDVLALRPVVLWRTHGFWILSALVFSHMMLTFAAQRLLSYALLSWPRAWSYRLAFLLSAGVAVGVWLYQVFMLPVDPAWWLLGSALLGSFAGGLLATAFDDGLWEDNYPPSQRIEWEVRRHHAGMMSQGRGESYAKRLFDLTLAFLGLILLAPVWMLSVFLVWFEDPGPIFFIKNSVGRGGINFHQIKFRSMIRNAEEETGPIPSRERDQRTLVIGRLLRKTALDELPQLINIIRGEMSFVGPRPLRTVVIYNILLDVPGFAERHAVRPGLAGLSQVIGGYYITPRQRLRFDRVYVHRMSLFLDIKILLLALLIVLWLRWGKEYHGRTARRWLRLRSY